MRQCVYCQSTPETLTRDHVFPRGWYSQFTPKSVQRWIVPCCLECNKRHGENEESLLVRFGLALDPGDPEFRDIIEKANRSIVAAAATSNQDPEYREKLLLKLRDELLTGGAELAEHALVLRDGSWAGQDGQFTALQIDKRALDTLATKLAIGLTYWDEKTILSGSYSLTVSPVNEPDPKINEFLSSSGREVSGGPSIYALWGFHPRAPNHRVYYFEIFRLIRIYVVGIPSPHEVDQT